MIDAKTLGELWDAHAERLLLIARSIGGPAEDAVQEAFVALASQRRLPVEPMAWLVRVTRNRLLQWHRSNQRRRDREQLAGGQRWFAPEPDAVGGSAEVAEMTAALQSLVSPEREIIVMHLWGEMTFESIAKVVGGSRAKAHRAYCRGLAELREKFECESLAGGYQRDARRKSTGVLSNDH